MWAFQNVEGAGVVTDMIALERKLAASVFAVAVESRDRSEMETAADSDWRDEQKLVSDDLVELYQKSGLASGEATAREFIRGIERQVASQAARHSGKRRAF